jgi:hypothetical protein
MPSISTILTTKRKQQTAKATTPNSKGSENLPMTPTTPVAQRHGPFIQIDNVSIDKVEGIKSRMLDLVPENLRNGAIKSGVYDDASGRLIVQLRITPKVVHFFSVNDGTLKIDDEERKMLILSESQKKKVLPLFHQDDSQETQPVSKKSKK